MTETNADFLPPIRVLGVGAVTSAGRGLDAIALKLAEPPENPGLALRVNDEHLGDGVVGRKMRRADRFARMAVIAAQDAWNDGACACGGIASDRVGLIVASGFGPHGRGFRFIDGVLDFGDLDALPTDFSHSVHGAAAAYIAEILDLRGPSLSITDFETGFEQAVSLAQCWLQQGTCERVIVGAVEELSEVLLGCASRMLPGDDFLPGEGAVFYVLGPESAGGIGSLDTGLHIEQIDLLMRDIPGLDLYEPEIAPTPTKQTTAFSPYFGHGPTSSAFQLLGGLLSLRGGQILGKTIVPNPSSANSAIDSAATFKPSCDPRARNLLLTRI